MTVKLQVNVSYFFRNPDGFPWDILGLSRPYIGPLHSYMCDAALFFCSHEERPILEQRPAFFELQKLAKEYSGIFESIVNSCSQTTECRITKARILVSWLSSQPEFVKVMQSKLDSMWRQGLISIPEGARPK